MIQALQLEKLTLRYATNTVVEDVSFSLTPGEIGCLLGASGSGKTTLLRAIAGFENALQGRIWIHGRCVSEPAQQVPAHLRGVGMVFQDHALFPHLSVEKNIAFGLQKLATNERKARVTELLQMIGLLDRAGAYPHQLSGGQQQRVALARALAPKPSLLLLDEPFASLDTELRKHLAMEVRSWLKATQTAAMLVTHDQQEAFVMADKVGVLSNARLQQWDDPYVLYHEPVNIAVAKFIGEGVLLPATVLGNNCLRTSLGEFCALQALEIAPDAMAQVLIRPDDVLRDDKSLVKAVVTYRQFRGAQFLYTLRLDNGDEILALLPSHHNIELQQEIGVRLELEHLMAFPL
jgi:iron(III) transport system ATP-binding protein